ncbi:MAG: arylesterase [Gammaproteobacteria bacterium]|nr:MAG: arylesterase [Gammaproteobacteria bacterium]
MTFVRILLFILLPLASQLSIAKQATILVMGDSLSAGYGIQLEQSWVTLLQQDLAKTTQAKVINASVSGETSSGGLTRLPALLKKHGPDIVIIELGGNDGLRGQPINIMQNNLQSMITASQTAGAEVILAGMQIPPNYGPRYTKQFQETYTKLAEKNSISLVPFLLEDVAAHGNLIQRDGIHPTAEAQPLILKNVLPVLMPLLTNVK